MSFIKRLRGALPSHASLNKIPGLECLGEVLSKRPWLLATGRRQVARGIGIGLAIGVIPLPIQMFLAAICAIPLRANISAAIAATWFTNPLTMGPIWALSGWFGSFFVEVDILDVWETTKIVVEMEEILPWWQVIQDWTVAIGKPVLIGMPITGVVLGLSSWFAVSVIWIFDVKRRRITRLRKHKKDKKQLEKR